MEAVHTKHRDNNTTNNHHHHHPSFSSTLLDEMYRSIDERDTEIKHKKFQFHDHDERRKASLIQKWMENEKPVIGRKSAADLDMRNFNSSSTSSDSSGVSSSEAEYGFLFKPKPIRTNGGFTRRREIEIEDSKPEIKHESKFVKTKSKALKIYSDLKKVKQPISPGGKLATFLNSIFAKSKTSTASASSTACGGGGYLDRKSKSANASTCSSASSFSRSCLSNTPSSSRGKLNNSGSKRSVRFFPVSEIVDEYNHPCGHKLLLEEEEERGLDDGIRFGKHSDLSEKSRDIEKAAMNLLKNYKKKVEIEYENIRKNVDMKDVKNDDGESDSSSDLFELDSLSYRKELPVYETTHLGTNRAIANGLVV